MILEAKVMEPTLQIGKRTVGGAYPVYFIADIAANHDGDLERAKALIHLAAQAGADAAKFQNFRAAKIVSDRGFRELGGQQSHQAKWKKSVSEVYRDATVPWEWTPLLKAECDRVGIDYFSAPYDFGAVDMLDPFVGVYKVGSGDITWLEMLEKIASKGKPVMLATGASDIGDVQRAMRCLQKTGVPLVLMQCNTNYTASLENFKHIHLHVLPTYRAMYPDVVLGLSDHTPGHATTLGAVALGACVIEKHFTDDNDREGPDHRFAMNPVSWQEMVVRTHELQAALGSPCKFVAGNERDTVVIQRRCVRVACDIDAGVTITREMLEVLRPAPHEAVMPFEINDVVGRRAAVALRCGEHLVWEKISPR
jgi:N-acetylneuraminate synthase